jgi:hypothetical protein
MHRLHSAVQREQGKIAQSTAPASPANDTLRGKEAYAARLKSGESVAFRESGNSMCPRIKSRELCTYAPVLTDDDVDEGDVVFCRVGGHYYTHMVHAKQRKQKLEDGFTYQIGNLRGHINGWTGLNNIYGRVVKSVKSQAPRVRSAK